MIAAVAGPGGFVPADADYAALVEQRAAIRATTHAVNNSLSVLRLTADLLRQQAIPPDEAAETIGAEVARAQALLSALRASIDPPRAFDRDGPIGLDRPPSNDQDRPIGA